MAGADRPARPPSGLGGLPATLVSLALALATGGTACTPKLPPPQTPPKKPDPAPAAATTDPGAAAAASPAAPAHDATLIVIDPGDADAESRPSLVEASKREKARKAQAGKPVAVITDETLPKMAKKGQLTFADLAKSKNGEKPPAAAPSDLASIEQEQYWRGRARAIRQRWRNAVDEGADLERQAADYRRKFYAESDPFRRDGEIKPSWDRTLDRLRLAKERADAAKKELGEFLEEGRRAGALPGWLREGAELEPEPPAPPKTTAEAIEPPILNPKDEM